MSVRIASYPHRTGEHCASTALRNLLAHHGTELSEAMVFGLASGLGFFYFKSDAVSPTRMFHGRTPTFEQNLAADTGIALTQNEEADDDRAEEILRERLDAGVPVLLATDTYYLGYHHTTSHFPGHTCVAVGYDAARAEVWIADRKFPELQTCSFAELRRARNAPDYPIRCANRWGDCAAGARLARPLAQAVASALRRTAREMLAPTLRASCVGRDYRDARARGRLPELERAARLVVGGALRLPDHHQARRRGQLLPLALRGLPARGCAESCRRSSRSRSAWTRSRTRWRALAVPLEQQSERETCDPALFAEAGRQLGELAELEHAFFRDADAAAAAIRSH